MTNITYQNSYGRSIVPNNVERDIALSYIGKTLVFPVTAITIIIGEGWREIDLAISDIRYRTHVDKHKMVYHYFGQAIDELVNSSYPEDMKQEAKKQLIASMNQKFSQLR